MHAFVKEKHPDLVNTKRAPKQQDKVTRQKSRMTEGKIKELERIEFMLHIP